MRIFFHNNQSGMILVLAMFMMALLSMIGIASMMTSTTDIEIASGERQYVETFYRAQAAHTIAGELLLSVLYDRGLENKNADTIDPNGNEVAFEKIDDYTYAFRILDPDITQEGEDSVSKTLNNLQVVKVWQVDEQEIDELPCPQDMSADECKALNAKIGDKELDLWTDIQIVGLDNKAQEVVIADIDIDKVQVSTLSGGGAEFGSKDLGMGSQQTRTIYNIDSRARRSDGNFDKSPSRQALGFRVLR